MNMTSSTLFLSPTLALPPSANDATDGKSIKSSWVARSATGLMDWLSWHFPFYLAAVSPKFRITSVDDVNGMAHWANWTRNGATSSSEEDVIECQPFQTGTGTGSWRLMDFFVGTGLNSLIFLPSLRHWFQLECLKGWVEQRDLR